MPDDHGTVNLSLLFTLGALAMFVIVALVGFGAIDSEHVIGFLGAGLAAWVLAGIVE